MFGAASSARPYVGSVGLRKCLAGLVALLAVGCAPTVEELAEWECLYCLARAEQKCGPEEEVCHASCESFVSLYEGVLPALQLTGCDVAYARFLRSKAENACAYHEAHPAYDDYKLCILDFVIYCSGARDDDACLEVSEYDLSVLEHLDLIS